MIDAMRLIEAQSVSGVEIDIKQLTEDRFKGLLVDQPEKLKRILSALQNPAMVSVKGKSLGLQIFTMNHLLSKLLYRFSGRTGTHIGTVRIALVDTADLQSWLNLLDMGVLPMFTEYDVV